MTPSSRRRRCRPSIVNSLGELARSSTRPARSRLHYDLPADHAATTPNGGTVDTPTTSPGTGESCQRRDERDRREDHLRLRLQPLDDIDHPGTVDDITYEYGLDNSDGRYTAGRIRHIEDRTRLVDNTYDKNGAMIEQTAIVKRHNWGPR